MSAKLLTAEAFDDNTSTKLKRRTILFSPIIFTSLLILTLPALGQYTLTYIGGAFDGGYAWDVAVSGKYAYVANTSDGLRIYDVSDPANPVSVAHTNNGGSAYGVTVSGNYAYLANYDDGLRIYDTSNPLNPVNVGWTNDACCAMKVAVAGNYAYLINGALFIYDISNPANPRKLGFVIPGPTGTAFDVAVSGNYAHVATYADGLQICNVSNPTNPVVVGHTNNGGEAMSVAVSGNYAYLGTMNGLKIYNVSNPTNPIYMGQVGGPFNMSVTVSGHYAYFTGSWGLGMFDISNPCCPTEVADTYLGNCPRGVSVSGNYIYCAQESSGFQVYAIKPPLSLELMNTNALAVSWSWYSGGFGLQQNSSIGSSNWVSVTNTPENISNLYYRVVLPLTSTNSFFRLKYQH